MKSALFGEDVVWRVLGNGTLLVLTAPALCLVIAFTWRARAGSNRALRGTGWLCAFGRLSYEIYLTHTFVVLAIARAFKASGGAARLGFLWYVPIVALSWALGAVVERSASTPCDRALRRRWLRVAPAILESEPASVDAPAR